MFFNSFPAIDRIFCNNVIFSAFLFKILFFLINLTHIQVLLKTHEARIKQLFIQRNILGGHFVKNNQNSGTAGNCFQKRWWGKS